MSALEGGVSGLDIVVSGKKADYSDSDNGAGFRTMYLMLIENPPIVVGKHCLFRTLQALEMRG